MQIDVVACSELLNINSSGRRTSKDKNQIHIFLKGSWKKEKSCVVGPFKGKYIQYVFMGLMMRPIKMTKDCNEFKFIH